MNKTPETPNQPTAQGVGVNTMVSHFNLTEQQEKYKDAITWLIDNDANRATGRSYLMACVFIESAIKYPGKEIEIFDHGIFYAQHVSKKHMLKIISGLVEKISPLMGVFILKPSNYSIRYSLP